MNLHHACNEWMHGCKPFSNGLRADFVAASKRAVALASGISLYCGQPRERRLCNGL